MKTHKQAKKELTDRITALEDLIKFTRENTYYEKFCLHCSSVMQVKLNGERAQEKKFCNDACRSSFHRKRNQKAVAYFLKKKKKKIDELKK